MRPPFVVYPKKLMAILRLIYVCISSFPFVMAFAIFYEFSPQIVIVHIYLGWFLLILVPPMMIFIWTNIIQSRPLITIDAEGVTYPFFSKRRIPWLDIWMADYAGTGGGNGRPYELGLWINAPGAYQNSWFDRVINFLFVREQNLELGPRFATDPDVAIGTVGETTAREIAVEMQQYIAVSGLK